MTTIMTPVGKEIEAVLCFCHGYMDNVSFLKRYEYQRLVKRGIAVVSIEYEGHGRSDGYLCYINKWDDIIQDVSAYFKDTCCNDVRLCGKKCFLMGESMGGAVAFDVYNDLKNNDLLKFTGVILCCPMAKISEELLPSPFVIHAFQQIVGPSGTARLIGLLPLSPSAEMNGFRLVEKRALAQSVPTWYGNRKPRLATSRELLVSYFNWWYLLVCLGVIVSFLRRAMTHKLLHVFHSFFLRCRCTHTLLIIRNLCIAYK